MISRTLFFAAIGVLALTTVSGCAAINAHHRSLANELHRAAAADDPLTGEWTATFYVHDSKTPGSFSFKLDGTKVTGTAYSDHTGPGTIREGKWEDGKLSLTLDFKKHESIAVKGSLKDGKLAGEFSTEGFTDKWEATKK